MDPGAYCEPLARTTWVLCPMVSGYVGSRVRIADAAFGTNYAGLSLDDNKVRLTVESATTGTTIFFQVNETNIRDKTATRTSISPQYGVVPNGRCTVDVVVNAQFMELQCVGGRGAVRTQIESRLKWEQMALDRTDMGAPELWQKKLVPRPGEVTNTLIYSGSTVTIPVGQLYWDVTLGTWRTVTVEDGQFVIK